MIEQLWYTWSTIGLGGAAGFQIRAASAGLANTRDMHVRQLDKYLRYELPPGVDHYNADLTNTPRCLAWLNADNQRIIVHKAYVGKDGYGRPGVFFCHLLAGVPETFPANAIIELWGSPFWQTAEPEGHTSTELPQLDEELSIVAQGELTQERILDVVDYLPSLIYAFFSLKESQKIYIAARDEQVATLIFGLTQSLPFLLQQDLTFSTYETDIAASPALIIGTDAATPEELPRAFPQTYRSEAGFAINCWKPPVVLPAGEATDYANLVKDCFRKGDISRFEAILLAAQESQVQDKKAFLDFVRVAVSIEKKSLTRNDVLKVLSDIDLASYYLKQPEMQVYLLQEALKDALWWQSYPATSIKQLKQSYGVSKARLKRLEGALDDFAGYIMRYACRCFERRSTSAYWYQLLQMLDIIAPPERNAEPWRALLEHHSAFLSAHGLQAREYCVWGTRLDLLQRWKHLHADIPLNQIKPWLPFDWIDFHEFLKHGFPESWQCVTLKELLASFSYPNFLGTLIMEHTPVFLQATRELWAQPEKRVTVLRLFQYVVEKTPQYQYLFLTPILQDPALDQRQLEEVLSCARLTDEQAVEVVKKHAAVLFQFIGLRSVQHIFCLYYSNFLYHWRYLDEKDRDIFNTLASSRLLNAKLIQLLEEFRVITNPRWNTVSTEALRHRIGEDIKLYKKYKLLEQKEYISWLYDKILMYGIQMDTSEMQARLSIAVESFAPYITGKGKHYDMLYNLACHLGDCYHEKVTLRCFQVFTQCASNYAQEVNKDADLYRRKVEAIMECLLLRFDDTHLQQFDAEIFKLFRGDKAAIGCYHRVREAQRKNQPEKRWYTNIFKKVTGSIKAISPDRVDKKQPAQSQALQQPGTMSSQPVQQPQAVNSQPMQQSRGMITGQADEAMVQKVMQFKEIYIEYRLKEIEKEKAKLSRINNEKEYKLLDEEKKRLNRLRDNREQVVRQIVAVHNAVYQDLLRESYLNEVELKIEGEYENLRENKLKKEIKRLASRSARGIIAVEHPDLKDVLYLFLRLRFFEVVMNKYNGSQFTTLEQRYSHIIL